MSEGKFGLHRLVGTSRTLVAAHKRSWAHKSTAIAIAVGLYVETFPL